ncbi:DUF6125 family protein [Chloroflexota bacterium]
MGELKDYSGKYMPELKCDDFSKETLITLLQEYARALLALDGFWNTAVRKRYGDEISLECETDAWLAYAPFIYPKFAKLLNIKTETVLDALKVWQMTPDGYQAAGQYQCDVEVKNENDVIFTINYCPQLQWFEKKAPEQIIPICHHLEEPIMQADFDVICKGIQVIPLKLPPRARQDEPACIWQFKKD